MHNTRVHGFLYTSADASSLIRGGHNSFDLAVIATKAQHVPDALKVADKLVGSGGPVAGILLIQNGIATTKEGRFFCILIQCRSACV